MLINILKRYEIIKELGCGATSRVYLAWDALLCRKAAIKVGRNRKLLLKEARCMSCFCQPCFPVLYDYAEEREDFFLVMEYVEGENLRERFGRIGRYTEEEVAQIACQTARALHFLHTGTTPYVYGDIKPENIMMQADGIIKLVDFGTLCPLAGAAGKEKLRGGTPMYAPPEMWQGRPDVRSDIYALGRLMLFLLQTDGRQLIGPGMERVIERCTQKRKEHRYRSMEEIITELVAL